MPDIFNSKKQMLLVDPEQLLRRTVALTARTIGMGTIYEAANAATATRILNERGFDSAVIAVDYGASQMADLELLDQVRAGKTASDPEIPIAVLAERCDADMIKALRERAVNRIILKPFRARVLLETFGEFSTKAR